MDNFGPFSKPDQTDSDTELNSLSNEISSRKSLIQSKLNFIEKELELPDSEAQKGSHQPFKSNSSSKSEDMQANELESLVNSLTLITGKYEKEEEKVNEI